MGFRIAKTELSRPGSGSPHVRFMASTIERPGFKKIITVDRVRLIDALRHAQLMSSETDGVEVAASLSVGGQS